MYCFEDQGLTLRLFASEDDAKFNSNAVSVARYGPGVIAKNQLGKWIDAHGVLPEQWSPSAKLLTMPDVHGYFVDASGRICCADVAPRGTSFVFIEKARHKELWIVSDKDGEVIEEYVLHESLESMAAQGVKLVQPARHMP